MFNSAVLDVAIGMVFVFLIVSFGVTSGNELIASLLKWRATTLATGIRQLVDDPGSVDRLSDLVYRHALIRGLHRDATGDSDRLKPSFIPARLFATALLDLALKPGDARARAVTRIDEARVAITANETRLGAHMTQALRTLCDHAESDTRSALGDVEKLQDAVEHWFNSSMDRVASWYKRKTQLSSVILALAIAAFVDVDSIRLARVLANNPVLRAALIADATKARPEIPGATAAGWQPVSDEATREATVKAYKATQTSINEITDLGIPVGWGSEIAIPTPVTCAGALWWLYKLGGIALTAMAASLGAPFWFDLLQKLFALRSGKIPDPVRADRVDHPPPAPVPASTPEVPKAA